MRAHSSALIAPLAAPFSSCSACESPLGNGTVTVSSSPRYIRPSPCTNISACFTPALASASMQVCAVRSSCTAIPEINCDSASLSTNVSTFPSTGTKRSALLTDTTLAKMGLLTLLHTHANVCDGRLESITTASALTITGSRCSRNSGVMLSLIFISSRAMICFPSASTTER